MSDPTHMTHRPSGLVLIRRAGHPRQVGAVQPNYADDPEHSRQLIGGQTEPGEPPRVAAARHLLRETGLRLPIGRLMALDNTDARKETGRKTCQNHIYDAGFLEDGVPIELPPTAPGKKLPELARFRWLTLDRRHSDPPGTAYLDQYTQSWQGQHIRASVDTARAGDLAELHRGVPG
ncbi:NUDIX domain-containing protein [Streptomyces sp. NPDC059788]|uniref:NUDIX domain-containing protein n=1 Tax=Streptomyces sp. NPDC059788 TaxID=3346948 RepID=UPI00364C9E75